MGEKGSGLTCLINLMGRRTFCGVSLKNGNSVEKEAGEIYVDLWWQTQEVSSEITDKLHRIGG
jgi:hypothetical protein